MVDIVDIISGMCLYCVLYCDHFTQSAIKIWQTAVYNKKGKVCCNKPVYVLVVCDSLPE